MEKAPYQKELKISFFSLIMISGVVLIVLLLITNFVIMFVTDNFSFLFTEKTFLGLFRMLSGVFILIFVLEKKRNMFSKHFLAPVLLLALFGLLSGNLYDLMTQKSGQSFLGLILFFCSAVSLLSVWMSLPMQGEYFSIMVGGVASAIVFYLYPKTGALIFFVNIFTSFSVYTFITVFQKLSNTEGVEIRIGN